MERGRPLFDCESGWRPGGPGSDAVASGRKILLALGIQAGPFALLLCYSLGMMGILTPYATGPAPVYFGSGYITRKAFWRHSEGPSHVGTGGREPRRRCSLVGLDVGLQATSQASAA